MSHVKCTIGASPYAVTAISGKHSLIADEPAALGGADAGLAPYDLLLASLGACTAITLRMYANRKQWSFDSLEVDLHYAKSGERGSVERTIVVHGALTAEQKARMAEIAERTPVTLSLKPGMEIRTRVT
jgi:putative redox protein